MLKVTTTCHTTFPWAIYLLHASCNVLVIHRNSLLVKHRLGVLLGDSLWKLKLVLWGAELPCFLKQSTGEMLWWQAQKRNRADTLWHGHQLSLTRQRRCFQLTWCSMCASVELSQLSQILSCFKIWLVYSIFYEEKVRPWPRCQRSSGCLVCYQKMWMIILLLRQLEEGVKVCRKVWVIL